MLIRSQHLPLRIRITSVRSGRRPSSPLDPLARYDCQGRVGDGVAEERDRVPGLGVRLAVDRALPRPREHDPMHRAAQQPVGPVRQQVADVDEDRRRRVVLGAGRRDGHGRPGVLPGVDLQAGLAALPEEERDGAVVGVRAGADVLDVGVGLLQRRIVQEAKSIVRAAVIVITYVSGREKVRGVDAEADT